MFAGAFQSAPDQTTIWVLQSPTSPQYQHSTPCLIHPRAGPCFGHNFCPIVRQNRPFVRDRRGEESPWSLFSSLSRDSDHCDQWRIRSHRPHLAAGMFPRIQSPGGQRHSRNDLPPRRLGSCEMGNTARWDQGKSPCDRGLAGEKSWIYLLVRTYTSSDFRIIPALTLDLRW